MASRIRHILIVDDDPCIRYITRIVLEDQGHTVYEADNVTDGLHTLRRMPTDPAPLVLLDLNLAGDTGLDFLRRVDAIEARTQVIVISAMADSYSAYRAELTRAQALLAKPVPAEQLLATIDTHAAPKPSPQEARK
jgi:DNA-binding NtrC family response regulator